MNRQAADAAVGGPANQAAEVIHMAVHSTVGAETEKMQGAAVALHPLGQLLQGRGVTKLVIANGVADAHQLLADDPAGTDGEVPHLGIAHLLVRQSDVGTAGLDQSAGIGMAEGLHHRRLSRADGVVVGVLPMAPAIKNGEDHRSDCSGLA